ncbi:MAG: hypothetical protein E6R04_09740 [Spirochaetes bacterium]|nr:MAG: hypothetical protein E6R04_09740 [Spirochaetota bacterium]
MFKYAILLALAISASPSFAKKEPSPEMQAIQAAIDHNRAELKKLRELQKAQRELERTAPKAPKQRKAKKTEAVSV